MAWASEFLRMPRRPTLAVEMKPYLQPSKAALSQPMINQDGFQREGGSGGVSLIRSVSMRSAMQAGPDDCEDCTNCITDSTCHRD